MRTLLIKLALLTLLAFAFAACQREDNEDDDRDTTMTEDVAQSESTIDASVEEIDGLLEGYGKTSGCATITTANTTFPYTFTIDFGTGCLGADGRTRKGVVTVTQTDSMDKAGAVRTIVFTSYEVSNKGGSQFVAVAGTHTLTNNGAVAGCPSYTATMSGGSLTFPDGTTRTWNATRTRVQLAGCGTQTQTDDVYEWTGAASGADRYNRNYSVNIITALEKAAACTWIGKGVVEVSRGARTRTIEYGTGACDDQATLTLANGTIKTIQLR